MATLDTRLMYFRSRAAAGKKQFLCAEKWTRWMRKSPGTTAPYVCWLLVWVFPFFFFFLCAATFLWQFEIIIVAQQQHFYISLLHRTAHFSFVFQLKWFSFLLTFFFLEMLTRFFSPRKNISTAHLKKICAPTFITKRLKIKIMNFVSCKSYNKLTWGETLFSYWELLMTGISFDAGRQERIFRDCI